MISSNPIRITALVPSYNEAQRVSGVLRILRRAKGLAQVWCVDDGSDDGTAQVVQRNFPEVKILSLKKNRGKAGAVLAAVRKMKSDYVLLADADLQHLNRVQLQAGIDRVVEHPDIAMLIFVRTAEVWWAWVLRGNDLFSGERIIRRDDLLKILEGGQVQGYQLEVAMNKYMLEHNKTVRRMPLYCKSVLATDKVGWKQGMQKESRMFKAILDYLGLSGLMRQMFWFPPLGR